MAIISLGKRIHKAREARGLSLRALAEKIGISHNAIKKYEHGDMTPSSAMLLKLAKILHVKVEYFFRTEIESLKIIEYRNSSTVSKEMISKIEDHVERRVALNEIIPAITQQFEPVAVTEKINNLSQIEELAYNLRQQWQLGNDAIRNFVEMLEEQGIWVFAIEPLLKNSFDGMLATYKENHIIVVDADCPGDRQRFTLAHELAHLQLENNISKTLNLEQACDRFAGAFLLPKANVVQIFGSKRKAIEMLELKMVKDEFGLSMTGILHRLQDLNIISKKNYTSMRKAFEEHGWLKKEPGDPYPRELIHHFQQYVFHALAEDMIGESKAAELMNMSLTEFQSRRSMESVSEVAN
jgi:Zn-dependent peptidase ImmA (M78 family)/DNA-binding XRE family transcriptional regulator